MEAWDDKANISQTPTPGPTQDLKCAQCKFKNMLEMMLKKDWLCSLFEIVF
jgi:hypothetical protein